MSLFRRQIAWHLGWHIGWHIAGHIRHHTHKAAKSAYNKPGLFWKNSVLS
jgi:hypothetical protein